MSEDKTFTPTAYYQLNKLTGMITYWWYREDALARLENTDQERLAAAAAEVLTLLGKSVPEYGQRRF